MLLVALSAALIVESDSDGVKIVTFDPNGFVGEVIGAPEDVFMLGHAESGAAEADATPATRNTDATDATAMPVRTSLGVSALKTRLRCNNKATPFVSRFVGRVWVPDHFIPMRGMPRRSRSPQLAPNARGELYAVWRSVYGSAKITQMILLYGLHRPHLCRVNHEP